MAVGKVHHFSETPPHHDARTCQSEGERHPYANESVAHYESAQIAYGQRNDEEGYEGNHHKRLHVGYSAQRVGVVYLLAVAKLIDEEGQHERQYRCRHLGRIGKPRADVVAQKE